MDRFIRNGLDDREVLAAQLLLHELLGRGHEDAGMGKGGRTLSSHPMPWLLLFSYLCVCVQVDCDIVEGGSCVTCLLCI